MTEDSSTTTDPTRISLMEEYRLLHDVARILQTPQDTHSLLQRVLRTITEFDELKVESKAGVFLVDQDKKVLRLHTTYGRFTSEFLEKEKEVPFGDCLCGRVAESGELLMSDSCFKDPRHERTFTDMTPHGHYIVPLKSQDTLVGVMFLYTQTHPTWYRFSQEVLLSIGGLIADAVERNRNEEQLVRYREQLENIVKDKTRNLDEVRTHLKEEIDRREEIDQVLKEKQRQLATLISNLPGMAYRCRNDSHWTMEYVSEGCLEMTGYFPEELIGNREIAFGNLIAEEDRERVRHEIESALSAGEAFRIRYQIKDKAGRQRWLWEQGRAVDPPGSASPILEGFISDISESRKAAEQVKITREQLRKLNHRMQSIQEEERTRIAREVHDELGQALTALSLDIAWVEKNSGKPSDSILQKFQDMQGLIQDTIKRTQRISSELRPQVLDVLGLCDALRWQAEQFRQRTGIPCELDLNDDCLTLDADRATSLFRIFQEALTNITRHAQATKVNAGFLQKGDEYELWVEDNGRGISEERLNDPGSLGLLGIRERAFAWSGKAQFDSGSEGGTRVTVHLPVKTS